MSTAVPHSHHYSHHSAHAHHAGARRPGHRRRFARHLGEMMLAMVAGMAVGGVAAHLLLAPFGASLTDASASVQASVMAFNMTVPMVAWMHLHHRMPVARSVEMAASMLLPSILAIVLYAASVIASDAVLAVQHIVMIPAMLAVMVWRYDAYSH